MSDVEFRDWLEAEVRDRRMTLEQRDDLLEQKQCFDQNRAEIEKCCQQRVVAYVAGIRQTGATVQGTLDQARRTHPGRMVYFEPVGFELELS
jgi:hypothetical protein